MTPFNDNAQRLVAPHLIRSGAPARERGRSLGATPAAFRGCPARRWDLEVQQFTHMSTDDRSGQRPHLHLAARTLAPALRAGTVLGERGARGVAGCARASDGPLDLGAQLVSMRTPA